MNASFIQAIDFNGTVIRNTPLFLLREDPFDDLADTSFEREFACRFLHQKASNFSEKIQYHVIDYVFSQKNIRSSRFGDTSYPVWYSSLDMTTTFYETSYHWIKHVLEDMNIDFSEKIYQERSLFRVNCNAVLVDLRGKEQKVPALIDKTEEAYLVTQKIGKKWYERGSPGLCTYSARVKQRENVVIYDKMVLTNPEYLQDVFYEFDPKAAMIFIRDMKTEQVITEISQA